MEPHHTHPKENVMNTTTTTRLVVRMTPEEKAAVLQKAVRRSEKLTP
jgi:hypothetical protein